jgi:excisionase family DNA binding protein
MSVNKRIPPKQETEYLDIVGVQAILPNMNGQKLTRWAREGRIPAIKLGKKWLWKKDDLMAFLEQQKNGYYSDNALCQVKLNS